MTAWLAAHHTLATIAAWTVLVGVMLAAPLIAWRRIRAERASPDPVDEHAATTPADQHAQEIADLEHLFQLPYPTDSEESR